MATGFIVLATCVSVVATQKVHAWTNVGWKDIRDIDNGSTAVQVSVMNTEEACAVRDQGQASSLNKDYAFTLLPVGGGA